MYTNYCFSILWVLDVISSIILFRIFLLIDEPSSQLMHRLKKDMTCLVEVWKVLVLERSENWLKGGSIPSLRHSVVDEERMRLVVISMVRVSALSFLQCVDSQLTGGASGQ